MMMARSSTIIEAIIRTQDRIGVLGHEPERLLAASLVSRREDLALERKILARLKSIYDRESSNGR